MASNFALNDLFKNNFDFSQLMATQRRNFETLAALGQANVETIQALSRRGVEVARDNAETIQKATGELAKGGSPDLSKSADLAKSIFENSLANLREISETVTKASFEAFDVLNKRAAESLSELSNAAPAASSAKKKNAA